MQGPGQNSRLFVTFIRAASVLLYSAAGGRFMEAIDTEQVSGFKIANWSVISQASVLLISFFNSGLKTVSISNQTYRERRTIYNMY